MGREQTFFVIKFGFYLIFDIGKYIVFNLLITIFLIINISDFSKYRLNSSIP